MVPLDTFPLWISTALLFWFFILSAFVPMLTILIFKKNSKFDFLKLKLRFMNNRYLQ